jgi:hypothetical protein
MCTAKSASAVGFSTEYMILCCMAGALYGTAVITPYYCSRNVTLKMAGLPTETRR